MALSSIYPDVNKKERNINVIWLFVGLYGGRTPLAQSRYGIRSSVCILPNSFQISPHGIDNMIETRPFRD